MRARERGERTHMKDLQSSKLPQAVIGDQPPLRSRVRVVIRFCELRGA